jgi:methylenetetrahydrofolate reductase (NADPH)
MVPKTFGVDVPQALASEMSTAADPERAAEIGIRWSLEQALGLLEQGVPSLHFYVMQNTRPFVTLVQELRSRL